MFEKSEETRRVKRKKRILEAGERNQSVSHLSFGGPGSCLPRSGIKTKLRLIKTLETHRKSSSNINDQLIYDIRLDPAVPSLGGVIL